MSVGNVTCQKYTVYAAVALVVPKYTLLNVIVFELRAVITYILSSGPLNSCPTIASVAVPPVLSVTVAELLVTVAVPVVTGAAVAIVSRFAHHSNHPLVLIFCNPSFIN
jgi:hypothetical protein